MKNKKGKFIAAGGILIVVLAFIFNQKTPILKNSDQKINTTPALVEEEYPVDEINDGVYTNSQYRYQFKYSTEFFKKQLPYNNNYQRWSSLLGDYMEDVILDTSVTEGKPGNINLYDFWDEVVDLSSNKSALEGSIIKISDVDKDSARGVYYFFRTPRTFEAELTYGYVAEWFDGNATYYVSMTSGNKRKILQNKQYFDEVVNSFKIF